MATTGKSDKIEAGDGLTITAQQKQSSSNQQQGAKNARAAHGDAKYVSLQPI
jgi:hypothetical protein